MFDYLIILKVLLVIFFYMHSMTGISLRFVSDLIYQAIKKYVKKNSLLELLN